MYFDTVKASFLSPPRALPEGFYNLGNAVTALGDYQAAIDAYERALEARPDWPEARDNLELVRRLAERPAEEPQEEEGGTGSTLAPDEIRIDETGERKGGEMAEVPLGELTDEQIDQLWMRQVQTSPADFLRIKFAVQAERREEEP